MRCWGMLARGLPQAKGYFRSLSFCFVWFSYESKALYDDYLLLLSRGWVGEESLFFHPGHLFFGVLLLFSAD